MTTQHAVPRRWLIPALALLVATALTGQVAAQEVSRGPVTLPSRFVQGFSKPVSGALLIYPWAYPGQARALLTRATDGKMSIEWQAEAPPTGRGDELISFVWHAGFASAYGAHRFTLSLNSRPLATFTSGRDTNDREWTVQGQGGSTVSFKTTRVGRFNELFGLMVLTLPRDTVGAGATPHLSVVGEAAGSQDYYMTFQEPVREWARARAQEAVFKGGQQVLRVELSHPNNIAPLVVRSAAETLWTGTVQPGYTSLLLRAPATAPADVPITVEIDGRRALAETVTLAPVRKWEVHLLPHSHVDIGYSDPQPEVEHKQWKNLSDAVALAVKTAAYPPEARFRWNVEGLWSVESYLRQAAPEARKAFADAVKAGSIGLQANYTNVLTGLCPPEELAHWTDAARQIQSALGIGPIRSAMHADVPGLSWNVVSALAQAGVRYFSSGPNYQPGLPDNGDRIGQTLAALGDRPFWWVSPSGQERILFWMAGRGYSWFHGLNMGKADESARQAIIDYLGELADAGYAYDMVQVHYTIGGDNGPVDPDLPQFVRSWNETFDSPRLVINTAEAMFAEFEKRFGGRLPTRGGDMTPYWEDGALSSAAEEALVRGAVRRLVQAEALWALRNPAAFPAADATEAWRQAILWHEHTWGAAASVSDPDSKDVGAQWEYKRTFATEADRRATALMESAQSKPGSALDIVNTLSWPRGGLVVLPKALSGVGNRVKNEAGKMLPSQRLSDGSLAVLVDEVPAFGSTRLTVIAGAAVAPPVPVRAEGPVLDNGRIKLTVNSIGAIQSVQWMGAPDREFAAPSPGFNSYFYVDGLDPTAAKGVGTARAVIEDAGPLVATFRIESSAFGARSLVRRVRLVAGRDVVELIDALDKAAVRTKESAHLAFPMEIPGGILRADLGGAIVAFERDQMPGSCREFVGVHSAIDASNDAVGMSIVSLDAPLIELGAMIDERKSAEGTRTWREHVAPGTHVFAYLLDNYWHTNYRAEQDGVLTFRFTLAPHGPFNPAALRRLGADREQPLLLQPVAPTAPRVRAPFTVTGDGVVVSSLKPAGKGRALLVRLYNASDQPATAVLRGGAAGVLRISRADAGGLAAGAAGSTLKLAPFQSVLLRVDTGGGAGKH
jgi:alpha-mannosidase